MRARTLAIPMLFPLLLAGFAGCLGGDDGDQAPGPGAALEPAPCTVALEGLTAHESLGVPVQFSVEHDCPTEGEASGFEVLYATSSSRLATTADYPEACTPDPAASMLGPGAACRFDTEGTYYLRAMVPLSEAGTYEDAWSQEYQVTIQATESEPPLLGAPVVSLYDVPSRVDAGEPFTFTVAVGWPASPPGAPAGAIDAYHAFSSLAEENYAEKATACPAVEGMVPGDHAVTCTLSGAGPQYLRGHVAMELTGLPGDHWSDEVRIFVD